MAKFNALYYYTSKGEKKLNCYTIPVPKELVDRAGLNGKEVYITIQDNKIIIQSK